MADLPPEASSSKSKQESYNYCQHADKHWESSCQRCNAGIVPPAKRLMVHLQAEQDVSTGCELVACEGSTCCQIETTDDFCRVNSSLSLDNANLDHAAVLQPLLLPGGPMKIAVLASAHST
jgi:hypothetical protein